MKILGGQFKGRDIRCPSGRAAVRPMTGLVKKSLFDILGWRLAGAVAVDLYCGSGGVGLEALSRGARRCAFADRDGGVLAVLRRTIGELGLGDRCVLWHGDVLTRLAGWLGQLGEPVDLAFIDPPYADARRWDWRHVGEGLFAPLGRHLSADGLAVLRTPARVQPPDSPGGLAIARTRRYGDMALTFFRRSVEGP